MVLVGIVLSYVREASQGRLIAVDGKTIRRSMDTANDKAAVPRGIAWCQVIPDKSGIP